MQKKNKKKKILVFINNRYLPQHNGAAVFFHNTAKKLIKKFDIKVNRICSYSELKKTYIKDGIVVRSFPIPDALFKNQFLNISYFFFNLFFKIFFKKFNYDTIHCVTITWHTLIVIFLIKIFDKNTKVIIDHTLFTDLKVYQTLKSELLFKLKKYILLKADIIRSPSPYLSRQLKHIGLKNHQIFLPTINYNLFKIPNKKTKIKLRSKLNIEKNKFVLLSVGRVSLRKGSDILIKAFKMLNKKNRFKLILLGPCDHKFKKYRNEKDIYISDKKVENVDEYMKASDLFVLLSRNEGLGIVFFEALASGLRIVMPKIFGVSDFILNNNKNIGAETTYQTKDVKNKIIFFFKSRKKKYKQACRKRAYQVIHNSKIVENLNKNWN